MDFGRDIDLMTFIEPHGLITAEAWAAVRGIKVTSATRELSRAVQQGLLEWAWLVKPQKYWHPYKKPGAQALKIRLSVLCFCTFGEKLWTLHRRDGKAFICTAGEEKTACFLDCGAEADHVTRKLRDFAAEHSLKGFTRFTILTTTDTKAEKIRRSAHRRELPIPTYTVVVPILQKLLFHETRKHSAARKAAAD